MAYRAIHTKIWRDNWFLDLDAEGKLFFLYLCTGEATNMCGIYELSLKVAAFETGLSPDKLRQLLADFQRAGKIEYQDGVVWIRNLLRYNVNNPRSPQIKKAIAGTLARIPESNLKAEMIGYYTEVIPLLEGIDTVSIPHHEGIDTVSIPNYRTSSSSGHHQDINRTSSSSGHDTGADAPACHDDDGDVELEPEPEPDDAALVETAVTALLERNWNAGRKKAAEFVRQWRAQYVIDMCAHAKRVGLEAGWIREYAGSFTPGQKWESGRERRERAKNRGPTGIELMDSIERWMQ